MMRDWLPYRKEFQEEILSFKTPTKHSPCSSCGKLENAVYRCLDCFHYGLFCNPCCLKAHKRLPFHRIHQWNGQFFISTTLEKMGFILHIGHGGSECPMIRQMGDKDGIGESVPVQTNFTVVDRGGVYSHTVSWCHCPETPAKRIQLLHIQLYPASIVHPRTAFTFRLLEYFYLDSIECKTRPQAFFSKLRRQTSFYNPNSVQVSLEFITFLVQQINLQCL